MVTVVFRESGCYLVMGAFYLIPGVLFTPYEQIEARVQKLEFDTFPPYVILYLGIHRCVWGHQITQ